MSTIVESLWYDPTAESGFREMGREQGGGWGYHFLHLLRQTPHHLPNKTVVTVVIVDVVETTTAAAASTTAAALMDTVVVAVVAVFVVVE